MILPVNATLDTERARGWPAVADDALPALPSYALQKDFLRGVSYSRLTAAPTERGGSVAAAVLIAFLPGEDGLLCLLTQRSRHLRHHAGQISFPGGALEAGETAQAAALREAEEETGLPARNVEILGALPGYSTVTGFAITPIVALAERPERWQIAPGEVESVLLLPLSDLLSPAYRRRHQAEWNGEGGRQRHEFFSVTLGEHFVWGATAALLRSLHQCLLMALRDKA